MPKALAISSIICSFVCCEISIMPFLWEYRVRIMDERTHVMASTYPESLLNSIEDAFAVTNGSAVNPLLETSE